MLTNFPFTVTDIKQMPQVINAVTLTGADRRKAGLEREQTCTRLSLLHPG
jgi:hypothetical protein